MVVITSAGDVSPLMEHNLKTQLHILRNVSQTNQSNFYKRNEENSLKATLYREAISLKQQKIGKKCIKGLKIILKLKHLQPEAVIRAKVKAGDSQNHPGCS